MAQVQGSLETGAVGDLIQRTTNLPSSTAFTLAGWFKMVTNTEDTQVVGILFNSGNTQRARMSLQFDASLAIFSAGDGATDGGALSANTWYYTAMTCSGTAANTLMARYWNTAGTLVATMSIAGTSFTPGTIALGNDGTFFAIGRFSYWREWGAVLSQAELEAEMFVDTEVRTTNLISVLNNADGTDEFGSNDWSLTSITASGDYPSVVVPPAPPISDQPETLHVIRSGIRLR
jgi:hypothetical protein